MQPSLLARSWNLGIIKQLSRLTSKPSKWSVRPAKTQISLGIRPVRSESSLCAQWVSEDPMFLHADSEDSDQTGRMQRLIWVFAGRTCNFICFVMRRLNYRFMYYTVKEASIKGADHYYGLIRLVYASLSAYGMKRFCNVVMQPVLSFVVSACACIYERSTHSKVKRKD